MAELQTHSIVYALFTFGAITAQFASWHTITVQTFMSRRTSLSGTSFGDPHTALDGGGYTGKSWWTTAVFGLVFGLATRIRTAGFAY